MNEFDYQRPVGFFRVVASLLYDLLFITAILFFATLPLALIPDEFQSLQITEALKIFWYLLVSYVYFVGFWLKGGQTAGMKPWKIKLVGMNGEQPSIKQVTIRFFAAILSLAPAGLGFLWMIVDRNHLSLHDHISKSMLVVAKQKVKGKR